MDWVLDDKAFSEKYERARAKQAEYWADELVDLSDKAFDKDTSAAQRCKIDARKWVSAKLLPRKYGERPGDIHVNSTVNNFVVLTQEKLRELQQRKQEALMR